MPVVEVPVELQNFVVNIVLSSVVTILAPFIAYQLYKLGNEALKWVKANADPKVEAMLEVAIGIAVRAAEQAGVDRLITEGYAGKKDYAIKVVQTYLRARGLGLLAENIDEIAARIEEAILLGLQKGQNETDQMPPAG